MNISVLHDVFLTCKSVCTDTRKIEPGVIFFALKGPNFNGNLYAEEALKKGAIAVVIDEDVITIHDNIFRVDDVLHCLQELATYHRLTFDLPVIAITGTNGKTTTKELLNASLYTSKKVLYTQGNFNNHIGVPLTLLQLTNQHQVAIVEMGANKQGDIHELCQIANPTHGIITNIGKAHLEGFRNFEGVINTKTELYRFLSQKQGSIFYNIDDQILCKFLPDNIKNISYSLKNKLADYSFDISSNTEYATICYKQQNIESKLIGDYNSLNIAAALAVSLALNCSFELAKKGIEDYLPTNNRSELQHISSNSIIWDAYNANPTSMELALTNLNNIKTDKGKLAILGDMNELGDYTNEEHKTIIALTNKLGIMTYYVGPNFGLLQAENHFETSELLKVHLASESISNRMILIKGSRSIQLEKLKILFS
jgi:UDP-N-acetylmuramoyl-tripeptide--D-alanyl-D-alanine ligase